MSMLANIPQNATVLLYVGPLLSLVTRLLLVI